MAKSSFLNVDLDIRSEHPLHPISRELREKIDVLRSDKLDQGYVLTFEIASSTVNADRTVNKLCNLIENLGEKGRHSWDLSNTRLFDIGYSSVPGSRPLTSVLKSRTLKRVTQLGGSLAITIYSEND